VNYAACGRRSASAPQHGRGLVVITIFPGVATPTRVLGFEFPLVFGLADRERHHSLSDLSAFAIHHSSFSILHFHLPSLLLSKWWTRIPQSSQFVPIILQIGPNSTLALPLLKRLEMKDSHLPCR
jgi:hypothetical protein